MLRLDHITVIAPNLTDGVAHVRECLDLDVPFGTRHDYMGTYNHRLQLGRRVYLEIVALDPAGAEPDRPRWFGLDDQEQVRSDWDDGRRFRGWVASTVNIASIVETHGDVFGEKVPLPPENPAFDFSIPADGFLPLHGAAPSLIDHRDDPTAMADIPDLGARLRSFSLEHPKPGEIEALYHNLSIDRPPHIVFGPETRWRALIDTPTGLKVLT